MKAYKANAGTALDARIVLAALWVAEILSSLNGDTYRLHDPAALSASLNHTASFKVTPEILTAMSVLFVVPVFMVVLTLLLNPPASRKANRIIGIVYGVILLGFFVLNFAPQTASYEFIWAGAQLVFILLVVWHAWKRPKQEPGKDNQ